jgi:hypothetical protein
MKEVLNIKSKQLFNILLVGFFGCSLVVFLFQGFLSLLKIYPTNFNEKEYYGMAGFAISIISIPLTTIIVTVACWFFLLIGIKAIKLLSIPFLKEDGINIQDR